MQLVAKFFGSALIYILFGVAVRAILQRIMSNAEKAENVAYIVALVPTTVVVWAGYGPATSMIALLFFGSIIICDYFDKKNALGVPDSSKS